jgi:hypothetical protein
MSDATHGQNLMPIGRAPKRGMESRALTPALPQAASRSAIYTTKISAMVRSGTEHAANPHAQTPIESTLATFAAPPAILRLTVHTAATAPARRISAITAAHPKVETEKAKVPKAEKAKAKVVRVDKQINPQHKRIPRQQ